MKQTELVADKLREVQGTPFSIRQIQLRDTTENTFPDRKVSITGVVESK